MHSSRRGAWYALSRGFYVVPCGFRIELRWHRIEIPFLAMFYTVAFDTTVGAKWYRIEMPFLVGFIQYHLTLIHHY